MLKLSNTNVAVVTKQTTNNVSVMAMVNMKTLIFLTRVSALANSALTMLKRKHLGISAKFNSVVLFQRIVSISIRFFFLPSFTISSPLWQIGFAPNIVMNTHAWFAVNLKTVERMFGFVEFGKRFSFFASRAKFQSA